MAETVFLGYSNFLALLYVWYCVHFNRRILRPKETFFEILAPDPKLALSEEHTTEVELHIYFSSSFFDVLPLHWMKPKWKITCSPHLLDFSIIAYLEVNNYRRN